MNLKKILALVLVFAMVVSMFPTFAFAEEPAEEPVVVEEPVEEPAEVEEVTEEETPAPAEENPTEEPAEETPAEEVPAEETPAEDASEEETPAEETVYVATVGETSYEILADAVAAAIEQDAVLVLLADGEATLKAGETLKVVLNGFVLTVKDEDGVEVVGVLDEETAVTTFAVAAAEEEVVPEEFEEIVELEEFSVEEMMASGVVAQVAYLNGSGSNPYGTLADAINDAGTIATYGELSKVVTLLGDIDLTETVVITKDVTIDLNGHTITGVDCRALWVKNGTVTITGTGTVKTSGSGFDSTSSVIRVADAAANASAASLTVDTNVTVSSDHCYGITVFGVNAGAISLTVNGTVAVTGAEAAVSGNGTNTLSPTIMTINGTVSATQDYAIYHPGKGTLTVNGSVTGLGGVEIKSGKLVVGSGATITATATTQSHAVNNNGCSTSGYAIAALSNKNYVGEPEVTINSGATVVGKPITLADHPDDTNTAVIKAADTSSIQIPEGYIWDETGKLVQEYKITYYTPKKAENQTVATGTDYEVFSTVYVVPGEKATAATAPAVTGYGFDGWYKDLDTEKFDFDKAIDADVNLYAKYNHNEYTVTFDAGEGGVITFNDGDKVQSYSNTNKHYGDTIFYPVSAEKSGYTLEGWSLNGSTKLTATEKLPKTCPAKDQTYTAVWSDPISYTITYTGLDGATVEPANVTSYTVEDADFTLNNPTKPGYTFKGWKTEGVAATTEKTIDTAWAQNLAYEATWKKTTYTYEFKYDTDVTLMYDGQAFPVGTAEPKLTAKFEAPIQKLVATMTNYEFDGWYMVNTDDWGEETWTLYTKELPKNMPALELVENAGQAYDADTHTLTLTAKWVAKSYTITYNGLDDATVEPANPTSYTVEDADFTLNNPTKPGYTFMGWKYGDGDPALKKTIDTAWAEDLTYTAVWEKNEYAYTLILDGGKFVANKQGDVTGAGSDTDPYSLSLAFNTAIKPFEVEKEGYTFAGWVYETVDDWGVVTQNAYEIPARMPALDADAETFGTAYKAATDSTPATLTLKATWTEEQYTITYEYGDGGALPEGKTNPTGYNKDSGTVTIEQPVRYGYTFNGWTIKNGEDTWNWDKAKTSFDAAKNAGDMVFTAKWDANTHKVIFNANGGKINGYGTYDVDNVPYAKELSTLTVPTPVRTGYSFAGWKKDAAGTADIDTYMGDADVTYYAAWTLEDAYIITYVLGGGALPADKTNPSSYTVETAAFALVNPTREGYTFDGWDYTTNTAIDTNNDKVTTVTPASMTSPAALTFTAKWSKNTYSFKFELDSDVTAKYKNSGADVAQLYAAYGDPVKEIVFTRPGYTFDGLYYESKDAWEEVTETAYVLPRTMPALDLDAETFGSAYNADSKTLTLKAKWTANPYTLTYELDGGSLPEGKTNPTTAGPTTETFKLEKPTRTGYTFDWWSSDPAGVVSNDGVTVEQGKITEDTTFTAHWTANWYALVYDLDGGTITPNPAELSGDKVTYYRTYEQATATPKNPTKTGYTFKGWDKEVPASMPAENVTIKALWEATTYTLTYVLNDGALPEGKENPESYKVTDNTITLENPVKTGYLFKGWTCADLGITEKTDVSFIPSTFSAPKALTFTANWEIKTYTYTFDSNGGSTVANISADYDKTFTAPTDPTKAGYEFLGWYIVTTNDHNEEVWTEYTFPAYMPALDEIEGHVGQTLTLTAKWSDKVTYTVTYDLDGGALAEGVTNPETYQVSTSVITINQPSKPGYDFDGWTIVADEETTYNVDENYAGIAAGFAGNLAFKAKWTETEYKIKFYHGYKNDGRIDSPYNDMEITAKYKAPIVAPKNPERAGYTFAGWALVTEDEWGTEIVTAYEFPKYMPLVEEIDDGKKDTTLKLYATWTAVDYTITYDLDGGALPEGKENPTGYNADDETFALVAPEKTGYNFAGWTWDNLTTPAKEVSIIPGTHAQNFAFKANWEEKNYVIHFNGLENAEPANISSITAEYGHVITKPADPTKTGYTFDGWYLVHPNDIGETVETEFVFSDYMPALELYEDDYEESNDDSIDGYITLTAKWVEDAYTITYDLKGGALPEGKTNPESYKTTEDVVIVAPEKAGYTFAGWTVVRGENDPVDVPATYTGFAKNNGIAGNISFTAKWTANTYRIKFYKGVADAQGADTEYAEMSFTAPYDTPIVAPADPERPGYNFAGWALWQYDEWNNKTVVEYPFPAYMPLVEEIDDGQAADAQNANRHLILHATWTLEDAYKITYELDGGKIPDGATPNPDHVTVETETFTLSNPVKSGYTFDGWTWAGQATPVVPVPVAKGTITDDFTFTAHFTKNKYNIAFNTNGGSEAPDTISAFYDMAIEKPADPTKANYTFGGWYIVTTNEHGEEVWTAFDFPQYMPALEEIDGSVASADPNVKAALVLQAKWNSVTYAITYDLKDGALPEGVTNPAEFTVEDTVTIKAPTKYGYTFAGWDYEVEGANSGTVGADYTGFNAGDVTNNIKFTAKWTANVHNVTFKLNGGKWNSGNTADWRTTVDYAEVLNPTALLGSDKANWVNSDYDFDAWEGYTEGMTMPDEDVTLTATWKLHEYKITYVYDTPLEKNEQPVNDNPTTFTVETETFTMKDPSRDAFEFKGWKIDSQDVLKPSDEVIFTKGRNHTDVTLHTVWEPKTHTVTFDGNGGTWEGQADNGKPLTLTEKSFEVEYNKPVNSGVLLNYQGPVRPGYTFVSWEGYTADMTMPNEDVTFKANWRANYNHIYFHVYGGSAVEAINADTDEAITAPADPTWEGYTFGGWYLDNAGTEKLESFPTTMPAGGMDLYAKWIVDEYTITYNLDGGAEVAGYENPTSYTVQNPVITLSNPTKAGYNFLGWTGTDVETATIGAQIPAGSTGNRTYKANWSAATFNVIYKFNDNSTPDKWTTATYDQVIEEPTDPERTGYTFNGWYLDAALTQAFDFSTTLTTDIMNSSFQVILYAKWTINTYTVTFDTDGVGTIDPQSVQYGQYATKPTGLTKTGYEFKGWYVVKPDGTLGNKWIFTDNDVEGDVTLKAVWEGYEITMIWENNGDYLWNSTQKVGDTLVPYTFEQLPHRDGYRLDPDHIWEPELPETVPFVKSRVQIYHVNWIKQLNVFFVNEGKVVKQLVVDENSTLDSNPNVPQLTKAGYTLSWALDDVAYDLATPVTEGNITLVAVWTEEEPQPEPEMATVTFETEIGDAPAAQTVEVGTEIELPELTAEGYTFDGWFSGDLKVASPYTVTGDVTLTGKWTEAEEEEIYVSVYGNNLSVKGVIGLNFYVVVPEEVEDGWTAEFNYDGNVFEAKAELYRNNIYRFSIEVPAAEDRKEIALKLYDVNGNVIKMLDREGVECEDNAFVSSIYSYLKRSEGDGTKFQLFAKAMRNYCEYVRNRFSVDTDIALDVDEIALDESLVAPFAAVVPEMPAGISFTGFNLGMRSATTLNVYFTVASGSSISDFTFEVDGAAVTPTLFRGSVYFVSITEIPAAELDKAHVVSVNGVEITNVSALSYANNTLVSSSAAESTKLAVMALYYFNQTAKNYFGA